MGTFCRVKSGRLLGLSAGIRDAVAMRSARRLSSLGRNLTGVWYTDGAAEGGLKMM